jgi:hypothetical protein
MSEDTPAVATVITAETVPPPPAKNAAALVAIGDRGVQLSTLEDLLRFGRLAVEAGVAPRGMSAAGAAMAIQAGLERGLGPLGGLQQCVVINGVLSWRGQGAAALIQNSPACKPGTLRFWTEGDNDEMKGVAVAHRVGYAEADRREFSVKDARQAGLWGKDGPWKQYPRRQLAWRALGFLARDIFPDVLGGFPLAEEAQDFEAPAVQTPAERAAMLPPPKPDPLMAMLGGVELASHSDVKIPAEAPPFASHAEADRAIAEQESLFKADR